MKKLTIIVPVYNVEQYIRPCIESIFCQGLDEQDFEVILVNDGTMDHSFEAIKDITNTHSNIIIIEQENQGLSAARNTGMKEATGEYVLFVDSDDILIPNTLKRIIEDAVSRKPDILIAGFTKMTDDEINNGLPRAATEYNNDIKTGKEAFLEHLDSRKCYVWRTIYKRAFLIKHDIQFIPHIYFEDIPYTVECYLKADKCIITDYPFYIYRQRPGSIVSAINKKKVMDFHHVQKHLWERRTQMQLTSAEQQKLMKVIFTTFSIELWYITHNKDLLAARKEIMSDLKRMVPDLYFSGGVKEVITTLFYKTMPNTFIWLRSLRG